MGKSLKHLTTVQTSSFWSPWHVDTLATSSTLDIALAFFCHFEHISYFCYFYCIAYLGYFYIVYVFFFRLFFLQYLPFTSLIYMLSYIPLILMYHPISFSSLQLLLSLILIDIYIISPFFFFANISALSPITAISVVLPIPPWHFCISICSYWYSCTIASSCLISLSYPPFRRDIHASSSLPALIPVSFRVTSPWNSIFLLIQVWCNGPGCESMIKNSPVMIVTIK